MLPSRMLAGTLSILALLLSASMRTSCRQPPSGADGRASPGNVSAVGGQSAPPTAPAAPTPPSPSGGGMACVLFLEVDSDVSSFTIGGDVSDPLQITVRTGNGSQRITAEGVIPVVLYNVTPPNCPRTAAEVIRAVGDGGAGFVSVPLEYDGTAVDGGGGDNTTVNTDGDADADADTGVDGGDAQPPVPHVHSIAARPGFGGVVAVTAGPNSSVVGTANLTAFQMFLYSPQPWPPSLATGSRPLTVLTNLTMLRGALEVSSSLAALSFADLRGVSYPGYLALALSQDQVEQVVKLQVTNITFRYTITPDAGPIDFAAANLFVTGNVTAKARVPAAIHAVPRIHLAYPHIEATLGIVTQPVPYLSPNSKASSSGGVPARLGPRRVVISLSSSAPEPAVVTSEIIRELSDASESGVSGVPSGAVNGRGGGGGGGAGRTSLPKGGRNMTESEGEVTSGPAEGGAAQPALPKGGRNVSGGAQSPPLPASGAAAAAGAAGPQPGLPKGGSPVAATNGAAAGKAGGNGTGMSNATGTTPTTSPQETAKGAAGFGEGGGASPTQNASAPPPTGVGGQKGSTGGKLAPRLWHVAAVLALVINLVIF